LAQVRLPATLRRLADGQDRVEVTEDTVGHALRKLENIYPQLSGWILDERGNIRRHVAVFLNGERCQGDSALGEGDEVDVLPAITGGV
jgi:molybdopterin converting factor small subunit